MKTGSIENKPMEIEFDRVLKSFELPQTNPREYRRFSEIIGYLKPRIQAALSGIKGRVEPWMKILGYKNKNKFLRRVRDTWPGLEGPIPLKFLEMIGVPLEDLSRLMRVERKSFLEALAGAKVPLTFSYRLMAAIYAVEGLPAGIGEPEAIRYVQQFLLSRGWAGREHMALITFGGVKQISVTTDSSNTIVFPPEMKITSHHVTFVAETLGYRSRVM